MSGEQAVLFHGGRIHTMDSADTVAEALLVDAGRIVATGSRRDVERLAPAGTRKLDLGGASMVPGLLDTHPHLLHYGSLEEPLVKLWDCRNHAEIVARLTARAQREPAGEWIQATPVGEPHFFHRRSFRDLEEGVLPDRHSLDRASAVHPIVIQAWGPVRPSSMAFNSKALELVGIGRDTPERAGNVWIEKDAEGRPTGRISGSVTNYYAYDDYNDSIWRRIPFLKNEHLVPGTRTAIGAFHKQGVTGVYENHMMDKVLIDAYREMRREGTLEMRVLASQEAEAYGMPWSRPRRMEDFIARLERAAATIDLQDELMRFNGITIMWDGYCMGGAQMMKRPYLDVYGRISHGHRHITPEKAEYVMRFCAQKRLRLNILAMGTGAHEEVLALLERVAADHDIALLNWVLAHATTIEREQVERYKRLNFCHTTSMTFGWGEGAMMMRSMGREVLKDILPLRRFFDREMPVGGGSDWGPKNAWEQIQLSLTHEFGETGYRNLGPDQRITRIEALAMMTRDAARVMHWPDIGSLAPGHHADLAIVDRDPIECPLEELRDSRVLRTVFAGRTVWDAGALAA
ncbi:MAG: amidohydrolase [Burkholderiales bacterium]